MSQFLASRGQKIGASVSASALLMTIQDWFPLGLTGLISLQSKGLSRVLNTTVHKHPPEASVASIWKMLTRSPWWKTILFVIILIILFLLFAPWTCNCTVGFVSNCLKAFKVQMVIQAPTMTTASSSYYLGRLAQGMSVRRICWLNNLGTMPLTAMKAIMDWECCPFPLAT